MDTREIPTAARILAFAKVQQRENVTMIGDNAEALGAAARALFEARCTILEGWDNRVTSKLCAVATSDPEKLKHMLSLEASCETPDLKSSQLLICTGRPDLTSSALLPHTLRVLSALSVPGGRVTIEMYRTSLESQWSESWSQTESRYHAAAKIAGYRIEEINGVARDDTFPTTKVDIYAFTTSLRHIANLIGQNDTSIARTIRRVARTQRVNLKGAHHRNTKSIVESSLNRLLGGNKRRLFATLRLGE